MPFNLKQAKSQTIEWLKYDLKLTGAPFLAAAYLTIRATRLIGKHHIAFKIASSTYRTSWFGSYWIGKESVNYYLLIKPEILKNLIATERTSANSASQAKKFLDDPSKLVNGNILVLKSPKSNEKGAIVIKYSNYFLMILDIFNIKSIQQQYNIILEPSWAGYCELSVLAYALLPEPVFVQAYEKKDQRLLSETTKNLIPIPIGSNWFVNHKMFTPPQSNSISARPFDIIMIASWSPFKRHHQFFNAIKKLNNSGIKLKVALVGYEIDQPVKSIEGLAAQHGLQGQVTFFDKVEPKKVAELLSKSKLNIVWSRFEGPNRAIIEGMFCDTPGILREGFNFGERYDFINDKTGLFANDRNLANVIKYMLENWQSFSPRNYIEKHRTCIIASDIMSIAVKRYEKSKGRSWTTDLASKTNELDQMKYLNELSTDYFEEDHSTLAWNVKNSKFLNQ